MSKRNVVFLVIGILLMVLGVLVGLTSGWDTPVRYNELVAVASFDPGEITSVRAETGDLELRIYSGYDEPLEVNVYGMSSKRVRAELENGVLTVRQTEDNSLLRAFQSDGYVVLWLPDELTGEIKASTESGDIFVNGLGNVGLAMALATSSGEVSVYDSVFVSFSASTASGDIFLGDVDAPDGLIANSSSGYVSLSGIRCAGASARTSSGDISLSDVRGESVQAESASGWLGISDVRAAEVTLTSVSGDVSVWQGDAESLSVKTSSGSVDLELEGRREDYTVHMTTSSGSVSGVQPGGDGDRILTVSTSSGSINVSFTE